MVAIEYLDYARAGKAEKLPGCHGDLRAMNRMLDTKYGFDRKHIKVVSDLPGHNFPKPTRATILNALREMNRLGREGVEHLVVYYSGHGTQQRDTNNDESDGRDEAIVPADYLTSGMITDDEIARALLVGLPSTCRVTTIFDSCNSGTVLDLPYIVRDRTTNKRDGRGAYNCDADVVSLSGCLDPQTSASAYDLERRKKWRGAMTFYLERILQRAGHKAVCEQVVRVLRQDLRNGGFTQVPQLCMSRNDPAGKKKFLWE